jgi:hypothetical protein
MFAVILLDGTAANAVPGGARAVLPQFAAARDEGGFADRLDAVQLVCLTPLTLQVQADVKFPEMLAIVSELVEHLDLPTTAVSASTVDFSALPILPGARS